MTLEVRLVQFQFEWLVGYHSSRYLGRDEVGSGKGSHITGCLSLNSFGKVINFHNDKVGSSQAGRKRSGNIDAYCVESMF